MEDKTLPETFHTHTHTHKGGIYDFLKHGVCCQIETKIKTVICKCTIFFCFMMTIIPVNDKHKQTLTYPTESGDLVAHHMDKGSVIFERHINQWRKQQKHSF